MSPETSNLSKAPSQSTLDSVASDQSSVLGPDSDDDDGLDDLNNTNRHGFIGSDDPGLAVTVSKLREREKKWINMLSKWPKYSNPNSKNAVQKLKNRARKGIPDSMRGRAWMFLSGGEIMKAKSKAGKVKIVGTDEPVTFEKLESMECPDDWRETIEKDLHRQFPDHEMFRKKGTGKQDLFRVLKAWVLYNPQVGYCQGQAPVASLLVMNMTAEDAFWSLVSICENFIPGYYDEGLGAIQMDGLVLEGLLKKYNSGAYKILKKVEMQPVLYMTEWFMCCFIRNLPWQTVLRVFDIFLAEGVKVLFRVGLIFIEEKMGKKKFSDLSDVMAALKSYPKIADDETKFAFEITKKKVTEQELTKEFQKQKKLWEKQNRPTVYRNYFRRLPDDDSASDYRVSADNPNQANIRKMEVVHEEKDEDRWQGVSSSNYEKTVIRTSL